MDAIGLSPNVMPADLGAVGSRAEVLAQADQLTGAQDTKQVALEFESAFLSLLLKEMRQTLEGGLFEGDSADVYGGLFDMFMAQHLAESQALGVGQLISRYVDSQPGI